jgi:hypothetical protein
MTIISARKAGPTMPEALRRPATATTTPAMLNSTSNPCGSANARSAARDRRTPGAGASTADTGRSGSGDGDDVDGMAALLPWLAFSRRIPLASKGNDAAPFSCRSRAVRWRPG